MTDEETLGVYDERAAEYYEKFRKDLKSNQSLDRFMSYLPEGGHVLDLGCGPGIAAAVMARSGFSVLATDASEEMIKIAATHDGVTARQETFDDMDGEGVFDGIYANFSLLHAEPDDLPRHISAISKALKPGGVFHIGMKLGDGMHRDRIGRRYTFVTEDSLTKLLTEAGLTPEHSRTGEEVGLAGTSDPWVVMLSIKHG